MRPPDTETPLVVSTDGTAGAYITVPPEHADEVVRSLQARRIPLEVDQDAVLIDGKPALTVINLGRDADVAQVQRMLDELAAESPSGVNRRATGAAEGPLEFLIRAAPEDLQDLVRRIETTPRGGWGRRQDIEKRLKARGAARTAAYCFAKSFEQPQAREVAVWLQQRGARELYVSSLVPLNGPPPADAAVYNEILLDFKRTFVEPAAQGLRVQVLTYPAPTEPRLEDLLSAAVLRQLAPFRAAGGRGILTPADERRWAEFIARTHSDAAVLPLPLLSSWLEQEGWPQDARSRLLSQYDFGRRLLSAHEEEQVG